MMRALDSHRLRPLWPGALLAPAAFGVHALRYLLAYGGSAGLELQRSGHSYLHSVVPWLIGLTAAACGCFLVALGRTLRGHVSPARYTLSFTALWLLCSGCLVAIFTCQELLEGMFATGHAAGLAGVFGYGGWWAVPAAACIGLVLAACFHGARWALTAARARSMKPRRRASASPLRAAVGVTIPRGPIAIGWSDRGPPAGRSAASPLRGAFAPTAV
jgi:hypothetical protein